MKEQWQVVATAPNMPAAHAVASLLEGQGVPCRIKADSALLGEARSCAIQVEVACLHRARHLLAEARFTDAELDFLATGRHSCDDAKE